MPVERLSGGGEGSRTPDPLNAIQVLYQLSYTPGSEVATSSKNELRSREFSLPPAPVRRNHEMACT